MKHSLLRSYMKNRRNVPKDRILKDCTLVIDGDSYFRKSYFDSGCKFILGGEFDRYADYLKKTLLGFKESNVCCYVIFKGTMNIDIERRKDMHQKLIDEKAAIEPGDDKYYLPIFVKDVDMQVLDELNIRYYVCEDDARATLLDLSKEYNSPVLTDNVEYCLLGMSCITPDSIIHDNKKKQITCKIHTLEAYKAYIPIFDNMKPILMTIVDENGPLYGKIPEIVGAKPSNPVGPVLNWTKRQKREEALDKLAKILSNDAERKIIRESVDELRKIIFYKRQNFASTYFKAQQISVNSKDSDWIQKGAMAGKVAKSYMNLKNNGTFSGSWVICDRSRDDAMLPALDIVMYANSLLMNSETSVIKFIGRNGDKSCDGEIKNDFKGVFPRPEPKTNKLIKTRVRHFLSSDELFKIFVDNSLPGFNWSLLKTVPEDCWLLIITLVFYTSKANRGFVTAAYSVLMSYVTLGPISEKVGLIKRSNLDMCHSLKPNVSNDQESCTFKDCLTAAHAAIDYFYEGNIKKTFDRGVLHDLAEFQHCLQHMNYLNKLCGERIKSTNYYKTYNGTFVFNVLLRLKEHDDPMLFFDSHFKNSASVLRFFLQVKEVFENCLSSIRLE